MYTKNVSGLFSRVENDNSFQHTATHEARLITDLEPAQRPNPIELLIKVRDDLEEISYFKVDDGDVFLDEKRPQYHLLRQQPLFSIPSDHLITPRTRLNGLSGDSASWVREALNQNRRYTQYVGNIVSWDKSIDQDVWTTNIDTVFFHRMLFKYKMIPWRSMQSFLEIGCGGGHLTSLLVQQHSSLKRAAFSDISYYALQCTQLNVLSHSQRYGKVQLMPYWGKGLRAIDDLFDVIIINPPYIPVPPSQNRQHRDPYSGTGLLHEVLEYAALKLNPLNKDACVIINVSSMAFKNFADYTDKFSDRVRVESIGERFRVPLKIGAITQEWMDWLVSEGGVCISTIPGQEKYWHDLQMFKIYPRK